MLRRLLKGRPPAAQTNKAGGVPKGFGSPPASTDLGYHACICGLRGVASAILRRFRLQPHPKGRRRRSLFAITQARNTSAIIAAMTPRGCREPCSVALIRETGPSLLDRSWPYRASVDPLYSVTPVTSRVNCRENAEVISAGDPEKFAEASTATATEIGRAHV